MFPAPIQSETGEAHGVTLPLNDRLKEGGGDDVAAGGLPAGFATATIPTLLANQTYRLAWSVNGMPVPGKQYPDPYGGFIWSGEAG